MFKKKCLNQQLIKLASGVNPLLACATGGDFFKCNKSSQDNDYMAYLKNGGAGGNITLLKLVAL